MPGLQRYPGNAGDTIGVKLTAADAEAIKAIVDDLSSDPFQFPMPHKAVILRKALHYAARNVRLFLRDQFCLAGRAEIGQRPPQVSNDRGKRRRQASA